MTTDVLSTTDAFAVLRETIGREGFDEALAWFEDVELHGVSLSLVNDRELTIYLAWRLHLELATRFGGSALGGLVV